MKKLTVKDIFDLKGKRQFTEVYCSTPEEASACEAAGIDLIITSERNDTKAFRAAAPNTFFTIGMVYGDYTNAADAIKSGFQALRNGGDAVYCPNGLGIVKAMADEGIPVVGHVGFIPYKASWFGGFKAVGKTADDAMRVYERTLAYQDAGAIGVEMEIVPDKIAAEISRRVKIMCLSMGSGAGCDGQYLFATDILGTNKGHVPRHAKTYRDLKAEYERLHGEMIGAFREFKADVDGGAYPPDDKLVGISEREYEAFMKRVGA